MTFVYVISIFAIFGSNFGYSAFKEPLLEVPVIEKSVKHAKILANSGHTQKENKYKSKLKEIYEEGETQEIKNLIKEKNAFTAFDIIGDKLSIGFFIMGTILPPIATTLYNSKAVDNITFNIISYTGTGFSVACALVAGIKSYTADVEAKISQDEKDLILETGDIETFKTLNDLEAGLEEKKD